MTTEKKFKCEQCGKMYATQSSLKAHITKVHKPKEVVVEEKKQVIQKPQIKRIDNEDEILVRNGFHGILYFRSPKSGYTYTFNEFGDELYIEFGELKAAKNGDGIKFYQNNWLLIDDINVLKQLRVDRFYTNTLSYDELEDIFEKPAEEIEDIISRLNHSQRIVVGCLGYDKITNDEIVDMRVIKKLTEIFNYELDY